MMQPPATGGSKHKSGIPNGQNNRGYNSKVGGLNSLKKDPSHKQLGAQNQQVNALQQYHLNQLQLNTNSRLSSSKPILGGGVAGSKYIIKNQGMSAEPVIKKMSPEGILSKQDGFKTSGINANSKIVRESMSLN